MLLLLVWCSAAAVPMQAQSRTARDTARSVLVRHYTPRRHGDWHTTSRYWAPVTLYYFSGRYYDRPYRCSLPVELYTYHGMYFSPPADSSWVRAHGAFIRPNSDVSACPLDTEARAASPTF